MSYPLVNLKNLRLDMQSKEKAVCIFEFTFNNIDSFVAVCLLTDDDRKLKIADMALVRLRFMRKNDLSVNVDCYANSVKITAGLTELRKFFNVQYQKDGIGWLNGFLKYLGEHIPTSVPLIQNDNVIIETICAHERINALRLYPWRLARLGERNGKQVYRTAYTAQLASYKCPMLYETYKTDKQVTFCFSDDKSKCRTEEQILASFVVTENRR